MLIDTNGDGIGDTREFAGSHRYDTAEKLAQRFAKDNGGVTTVIIASGESQVDAVTAAGLAGNMDAAVLLTRSSMLPHNVARFIDEHNVTNVIVVGGTRSVSDDIVTRLEGLASGPEVDRVFGEDRYATAAAIGNKLGGPNPTWCGSDQYAAILVNGGDKGRADAVAIGPLAYALGLPVLLTADEELPQVTEDFLVDNKVERVVIVGGTSAVSAEIEDALVEDVGVTVAHRIHGGSAAGTSVEIAEEMLGDCADVLNTNKDLVALVNRDAIADGITSAPVLGRGLGGGNPVPILLVGDSLPDEVREYLGQTKNVRNDRKTHLKILAIGGTAVVSDDVMDAATEAAITSDDITATIEAQTYTIADLLSADVQGVGQLPPGKKVGDYKNVFIVSFSDPVDDTSVSDPTLYRINGRRLEAASDDPTKTEEYLEANNKIDVANGIVTVTLTHALEEGDTITVVGGDWVAFDKNGDRRPLMEAKETLGPVTVAVDRAAPRIEIVAVAGQTTFDVFVHEQNILYNELSVATNIAEFITVKGASVPRTVNDNDTPDNAADDTVTERTDRQVTVTFVGDTDADTTNDTAALTGTGRWPSSSLVRMRFTASAAFTSTSPNQALPTGTGGLIPGDVITVNRNAVRDDDGRSNALTRHTVRALKNNIAPPAGTGNFEIESVSIGNVQHGWLDGTGHASATIGDDMVVTAKADGGAAGAQGNDWKIFGYDDRPGGANNVYEWEIRVGVDVENKAISFTIFEKPAVPGFQKIAKAAPNLGNLADELVANDDFAAHFALDFVEPAAGADPDTRATALGATSPAGIDFGTTAATQGISSVGVIVRFNDTINSISTDQADRMFADLRRGTVGDAVGHMTVLAQTGSTNNADGSNVYDNQVHQTFWARSMQALPARSGFRVISANIATGYGDADPETTAVDPVNNVRKILSSFRPDASILPVVPNTAKQTLIDNLVPSG